MKTRTSSRTRKKTVKATPTANATEETSTETTNTSKGHKSGAPRPRSPKSTSGQRKTKQVKTRPPQQNATRSMQSQARRKMATNITSLRWKPVTDAVSNMIAEKQITPCLPARELCAVCEVHGRRPGKCSSKVKTESVGWFRMQGHVQLCRRRPHQ